MCTSRSRAFTTKGPRTMTNERQRTTGAIIPARTRAPIPVNSSNARVCAACTLPSILFSRFSRLVPRRDNWKSSTTRGERSESGLMRLVCASRSMPTFVAKSARIISPPVNRIRHFSRWVFPWLNLLKKKDPSFESTPWLLVFLFLWERFSAT